jgi:hypothetical protein
MSEYQEKEKISPVGEHIEYSSDASLEAASNVNEKAVIRKT